MATTYCQFGEPASGVRRCAVCGRTVFSTAARVSARCRKAVIGPGAELKALLATFGITATPDCQCNRMASQMDAWGPDESERREEEIVDAMQEAAAARSLPFLRVIGRKLVRIACQRARRKSGRAGH